MTQDIPKGILFILLSTLLLTSADAFSKWLVVYYHVGELMLYRAVFAVPVCLILHRGMGHPWLKLASAKPWLTTYRTMLSFIGSTLVTLSFVFLPLADALAVIFLSPVLITALSPLILGESVGWRRWLAVVAGFVGVLLITEPGQGGITWVIIIPLGAALLSALRDIATRQLGGVDPSTVTLFWSMVILVFGGGASIPFFGMTWPTSEHWLYIGVGAVLVCVVVLVCGCVVPVCVGVWCWGAMCCGAGVYVGLWCSSSHMNRPLPLQIRHNCMLTHLCIQALQAHHKFRRRQHRSGRCLRNHKQHFRVVHHTR